MHLMICWANRPAWRWQMLGRLSGHTHQVTTGCALVQENGTIFRHHPRAFPRTVRAPDQCLPQAVPVLDKAGAYGVEKGEWIVEAVHGSLTNVVGLPVERLGQELRAWFDTASARP